jgi:hypothetical protein
MRTQTNIRRESASQSEALKVAVGFSPRTTAPKASRRVATADIPIGACLMFTRRSATLTLHTFIRGLKPTATFTMSLRDSVTT